MADITIERLDAPGATDCLPDLAALLRACVTAGGAVSFVLPFSLEDSAAFWRHQVLPGVAAGTRILLVARTHDRVAGSVQLECGLPPNQPHRAEVTKLLVHPDDRRRGIARLLMRALEQQAQQRHRSLITLDTRTGDHAERLYADLGYRAAGVIPGFARDPDGDRLHGTTYMYKLIGPSEPGGPARDDPSPGRADPQPASG